MLAEARRRLPDGEFVQGDALSLPFPDGAFERIFTSYFYCHLVEEERVRFLEEARRVAPELVVLGSRHNEGRAARALGRTAAEGRLDVARLQARVRPGGARRRARRATSCTRVTGSSSCAPRDAVPVARLAEAGPAHLSRVRRGRLSRSSRSRSSHRARASARTCSARRPASSRATSGARGAAEPARRCAAGSSSTRRSSTRRSTARP